MFQSPRASVVSDVPTTIITQPTVSQPVLVKRSEKFWWKKAHYRNWSCLCWIIIIIVVIALIAMIVGLSVWASNRNDKEDKHDGHKHPYPPPHPSTPHPPVMDTVVVKGQLALLKWNINEITNNRAWYSDLFCAELKSTTAAFHPVSCHVTEFGSGSTLATYTLELDAAYARYHSEVYDTISCGFGKHNDQNEIDRSRILFLDHHGMLKKYEVCFTGAYMHGEGTCRQKRYEQVPNSNHYDHGMSTAYVYECSCPHDYILSMDKYKCEASILPSPCSNGYYRDNYGTCQDIDECLNNYMCPTGQNCANTPGSYTCVQGVPPYGYCNYPNDPCAYLQNAQCQLDASNAQGYQCVCKSGYYRQSSGHCYDVDECMQGAQCPYGQTCSNYQGGYTCQ